MVDNESIIFDSFLGIIKIHADIVLPLTLKVPKVMLDLNFSNKLVQSYSYKILIQICWHVYQSLVHLVEGTWYSLSKISAFEPCI